ncbi:MAG: hypothetical protein WAN18_06255 [Candidatus Sulfotelmatobacter sp.]
MPQYEQKTDSREFEVANPHQSQGPWGGDARADATDIVVRLWGPKRSDRSAPLTWKTDSVLIYMIADLVGASHGRIAEESPAIMGAHFDGSGQAMIAAKRIQTSILEFLVCRPGERVGAAVLLYRPRMSDTSGFSVETVQQALMQAKPGQILLAENVSERLRDLPGVEFRTVPALTTVMGDRQTELTELVWTTPERVALLQASVGDEAESQSDIPPVGATVIVHSPFGRGGSTDEPVPQAVDAGEAVFQSGSQTGTRQASPVANTEQNRAPAFEEFRESSGRSFAEGIEEFEERPFITRTRVIIGVVALVLVVAVIAVLYRPAQVSKLPIPPQQDQTRATEIPDKQPSAKTEPETRAAQPEATTVKTRNVKSGIVKPPIVKPAAKVHMAAQPQLPDQAADNRVKNVKDTPEVPVPYSDESGGVSQKDIPVLLRMAQQDAGAGNYDKARTEYRKILGLQPSNQDAKDGLHKLDIIQKDQQ